MGMTIDEAIKEIESIAVVTDEKQALAFALAVHTMKKYQMMRADYEARLKADMVAMLEELKSEFEENVLADDPNTLLPFLQARETCIAIIQQKINSLKAESES